MHVVVIVIILAALLYLGPKLIRIWGNETFDGPQGRTVRVTPEQKAKRFVFVAVPVGVLILIISMCS